jgi:FlgN protein
VNGTLPPAMNDIDTSLPVLSKLIEQRLELVRSLVESLETSRVALVQNDVEAIARGAAHQAELCRQWSFLEDQLRLQTKPRSARLPERPSAGKPVHSPEARHSAQLQAEWNTLAARIRYLTRVHWSLLRHLQRSLAVLNRVVESCAVTYKPHPALLRTEPRFTAGECAGE